MWDCLMSLSDALHIVRTLLCQLKPRVMSYWAHEWRNWIIIQGLYSYCVGVLMMPAASYSFLLPRMFPLPLFLGNAASSEFIHYIDAKRATITDNSASLYTTRVCFINNIPTAYWNISCLMHTTQVHHQSISTGENVAHSNNLFLSGTYS